MTSIIEKVDTYEIGVSDLIVAAYLRDATTLQLELRSANERWTVIVEGSYLVKSETNGKNALPTPQIADLVGASVRFIRVRKADGELEMNLSHCTVIVQPDNDFEAWQMYSSNGERLIAVPGDGVAVWRA